MKYGKGIYIWSNGNSYEGSFLKIKLMDMALINGQTVKFILESG